MTRQENVVCVSCGGIHGITAYSGINAVEEPELKARALTGELFAWQCPHCGAMNLAKYPLLYHDPSENLLIVLSETPLNAEGCPEGYIGRQVGSVGEFVEKVKIFDAGLDDIVIEMCKFITLQEMARDGRIPAGAEAPELKFYRIDGSDSELTFTYPAAGQMQMLSVGFNVYEDCAGILNRNPGIKAAATGLVRLDSAWLRQFFM